MADIRKHLVIHGRVQGVWFRESTRREADALGIRGWVRNLPDGTVEVVAEGPEPAVQQLAAWCRGGPSTARVTRVEDNEEPCTGEFSSFEIAF